MFAGIKIGGRCRGTDDAMNVMSQSIQNLSEQINDLTEFVYRGSAAKEPSDNDKCGDALTPCVGFQLSSNEDIDEE